MKPASASPLPELYALSPEDILARLSTTRSGLTEEQIEERRDRYGANEVAHDKPPSWIVQLFQAFLTPFNGVLLAVSVVSLFSDVLFAADEDRSFKTIIVLSAMVLPRTLAALLAGIPIQPRPPKPSKPW